MIKMIFGVLNAVLPLIIGLAIAEYWEHRAAGQPAWAQVHVLWMKWEPPLSLAAQRDSARIQLVQAHANVVTVTRAITVQNAAVKAQAAAGVAALAQAEIAVQHYRGAAVAASGRDRLLSAPLTGETMCERVQDADTKFTGTLR